VLTVVLPKTFANENGTSTIFREDTVSAAKNCLDFPVPGQAHPLAAALMFSATARHRRSGVIPDSRHADTPDDMGRAHRSALNTSPCPSRRRRGFTLVELLVVIAIIGTLVGLLLPAVQQARESARRSSCTSQLRQLGLALMNFHESFGKMPRGNHGMSGTNKYDGVNWRVVVLPFLEQASLYDRLNFSGRFDGDDLTGNEILRQLLVPGLRCPSSMLDPFSNPLGRNDDKAMIVHYVGISGAAPSTTQPDVGYKDCGYGWLANNGILLTNESTKLRDVTDGTSKTMLVGEQSGLTGGKETTANYRGGWHGAVNNDTVSNCTRTGTARIWFAGTTTVRANPNYNILVPNHNELQYHFNTTLNSFHPGGITALLADGSTRFLFDTIDLETLKRLAVRNDGEALGEF
jgi:prepilin-type N-terminal cleavage/methylation domain-containing protein